MKLIDTPLKGCFVIEMPVFGDERGFFTETYREELFVENALPTKWVQDNWSHSNKGVLRGMHFQKGEHAQAKLVRVIRGAVFDAVVDIRRDSPTYGKSFCLELSSSNKKALFVPRGFAHGFLTLEDHTDFMYKCDNTYAPGHEGGYMWNDPAFEIDWPLEKAGISQGDLQFSAKDRVYSPFKKEG